MFCAVIITCYSIYSELGSSDRSSIKDSGKGDSDFNDSDSDTSGQTSRNISTFKHQRVNSKSLYVVFIAFNQQPVRH